MASGGAALQSSFHPGDPNESAVQGVRPVGEFYLPQLDVLRFFAFLAVFIYHVPPGGPYFYVRLGSLAGRLGTSVHSESICSSRSVRI